MAITYKRYPLSKYDKKTVDDFLKEKDGIVSGITTYNFLMESNRIAGGGGLKNIEEIYDKWPEEYKRKYENLYVGLLGSTKDTYVNVLRATSQLDSLGQWPIFGSPVVIIPNENFRSDLMSIKRENLIIDQKNIRGFVSDKLKEIITDRLYVRDENIAVKGSNISVETVNQNVKVWVWCRAVNKIINLSPFIASMSTQKTDVGNFSISLVPVKDTSSVFNTGNENTLNYFPLRDKDGKSQSDYFHRNLQQNDIVFIRFERLKMEKDNADPFFKFDISPNELPGQVWDMIGLIDFCSSGTNYSNTDYSVDISGRDMLKLLVEDGAFFLSRAYIQSESDQFILTFDPGTKGYRRNFNGQFDPLQYEFLSGGRKIDESIGFIVNQLSNLGVLDEDSRGLFDAYDKKKRTSIYQLAGVHGNEVKEMTVEGIWQIIKVFVDEQIDRRRIVDMSSVSQESALLDQFMKLCQEPFVEFYGDTYGDEFNFIARQPPFTKEAIIGFLGSDFVTKSTLLEKDPSDVTKKSVNTSKPYVDNSGKSCIIDIEGKDVMRIDLQWDETYYAWYQIEPNTSVIGQHSNFLVGNVIPILFFSKIAETFGNHRQVVVDNYLSANLKDSVEYEIDLENYRRDLLNDLKFIVDTNIYLPFTRKGTVVLSKGDRRIKKGTFVRLVPTSEICYVEGVSNEVRFSGTEVNRTTTLEVSRCMIENYIKGDKGFNHDGSVIKDGGKEVKFSYFDIVDTELIVSNILRSDKSKVVAREGISDKVITGEYSVYIPPTGGVAFRNNNPGNLRYVGQKSSQVVPMLSFCKFDTPELGFKEELRQISLYQDRGLTVREMVNIYAPKIENDTERYLSYVCAELNCSEDEKLNGSVLRDRTFDIARIMIYQECRATVVQSKKPVTTVTSIKETSIPETKSEVEYSIMTENRQNTKYNFGLNDIQFDFFQKRKQFNILVK